MNSQIEHVNNIPIMQFLTGIPRITQSIAYMISLTEYPWSFQNDALWDNMAYWKMKRIVKTLVSNLNQLLLVSSQNTHIQFFLYVGTTSRRQIIVWKYNPSGCITALRNKFPIESLSYSKCCLPLCPMMLYCLWSQAAVLSMWFIMRISIIIHHKTVCVWCSIY